MCGGVSVSVGRHSNWSSHRMERFIKALVGFLKWVLLHMVIAPFLSRYFEVPTMNMLLRLFGYEGQDDGVPSQEDVERGEDPTDRGV